MSYNIPSGGSADSIINEALKIAGGGANEIAAVLGDIQGGASPYYLDANGQRTTTPTNQSVHEGAGSILGDSVIQDRIGITSTWTPGLATDSDANTVETGREVLNAYGITGNADIRTASGAMVIDDLMQKISTKVQVAAQLLSTANSINKTVSRIMSQG